MRNNIVKSVEEYCSYVATWKTIRKTTIISGLGLPRAFRHYRRVVPLLTIQSEHRANLPTTTRRYQRDCRRLVTFTVAIEGLWRRVSRRCASWSFCGTPIGRCTASPGPGRSPGIRLPRGNIPFIHVNLIHQHRHVPGRNLRSFPTWRCRT